MEGATAAATIGRVASEYNSLVEATGDVIPDASETKAGKGAGSIFNAVLGNRSEILGCNAEGASLDEPEFVVFSDFLNSFSLTSSINPPITLDKIDVTNTMIGK